MSLSAWHWAAHKPVIGVLDELAKKKKIQVGAAPEAPAQLQREQCDDGDGPAGALALRLLGVQQRQRQLLRWVLYTFKDCSCLCAAAPGWRPCDISPVKKGALRRSG